MFAPTDTVEYSATLTVTTNDTDEPVVAIPVTGLGVVEVALLLPEDFNGDGQADVAVLVKQRRGGKVGIAIFHYPGRQVHVIGAGHDFGNGGDDFEWMNVWRVERPGRLSPGGGGQSKSHRLQNEALFIEAAESAGAVVYWNGKKYVWYQQGD